MTSVRTIAFLFTMLPAAANASANVVAEVEAAEQAFWQGYNSCDYAAMETNLATDVEFYHDMGGAIKGKAALVDSVRRNICGDAQHRVRRETGTDAKTYLLKQGDTVYGALVTGTHVFHAKHGAAAEVPEGRALYSHLWTTKGSKWELSRVFSYAHGPFGVVQATPVAGAMLTAAQIDRYIGNFAGPGMPPILFSRSGDNLLLHCRRVLPSRDVLRLRNSAEEKKPAPWESINTG